MAAPEQNPDILRNFNRFMASHEGGAFSDEFTRNFRKMIETLTDLAASSRRASGKLKIEFSVKAEDGMIEVVADQQLVLPKVKRGRGVYWATPENNLCRRDPKQGDMGFVDVNKPASEFKTA